MSAMSLSLRPIVEEAAELREKMAQQESSFRQDREKLLKELERQKERANDAAKKASEALKSRDASEEKASASEKRALKLKKELEKKQEELSAAEGEVTRLSKKREAETGEAILAIERAFVARVVKPKLKDMKDQSFRQGYGEGFQACKKDVLAERPELADFLENLKYIYEDGYSAPEASEQPNENSDEHTVDDAAKETEEEEANDNASAEATQGQEVPAEKDQSQEAPVDGGDAAGNDQAAA